LGVQLIRSQYRAPIFDLPDRLMEAILRHSSRLKQLRVLRNQEWDAHHVLPV
jgi:hypothetical protein